MNMLGMLLVTTQVASPRFTHNDSGIGIVEVQKSE